LENCIKISTTFSLKMKKLRESRPLFYSIGGQGQETRHIVYPLQNGRLCNNVCLRRKNLSARSQMTMASHIKLYGVLFVLLVAAKRHSLEQICQVASTGDFGGEKCIGTNLSKDEAKEKLHLR
jgi:hypothetical protein